MKYKTGMLIALSVFLVIILFVLVVSPIYVGVDNSCSNLKTLLAIEQNEYDIVSLSTDTYDYYTLCSNSYDTGNSEMVIYYCEKSRDKSTEYSQKLREVKAEIPTNSLEIFEVRSQLIEIEIDYLFALYESAEYLESATRSYDAGNYAMGDANIEGQNKRITDHDNLIEDYSNLLVKYNKLKREMLI